MERQKRIMFGYNRDLHNQIEIHPLQAMVVELIYRCYAEGDSMLQIKKRLEGAEIPSPMNKKVWNQQSISNILDYTQYVGDEIYPQIIALELMRTVRQIREERARAAQEGARYTSAYPLSGKIICGECGRVYRRITDRNSWVLWRCANRVEHGNSICKNAPTIEDEAIWAGIHQHVAEASDVPLDERGVQSWILERLRRVCVQPDGTMIIEES